ncbi:MAG: YoaK family protein [Terracidiphilus sp.]
METTNATLRAERSLHLSFALLTFVTGLVDTGSYLSMGHVFTANMTGNVVLLSLAVMDVRGFSVARSMTALAFALAGGVLAGRLERWAANWRKGHWFGLATGLEAALLFAACMFLLMEHATAVLPGSALYAAISLTALAMGIRNGTVRRLGVPDITTTVLTLTVAGLASESSLAGGNNPRWGRRVSAVVMMFSGAAIGAFLLRHSLALVLGLAALISLTAALMEYFRGDTAQELAAASHA